MTQTAGNLVDVCITFSAGFLFDGLFQLPSDRARVSKLIFCLLFLTLISLFSQSDKSDLQDLVASILRETPASPRNR